MKETIFANDVYVGRIYIYDKSFDCYDKTGILAFKKDEDKYITLRKIRGRNEAFRPYSEGSQDVFVSCLEEYISYFPEDANKNINYSRIGINMLKLNFLGTEKYYTRRRTK